MGRLRKDHSGWSTHGKWLKLQAVKTIDNEPKHKSKKNKAKWCKGKAGKEHTLIRLKPLNYCDFDKQYLSYTRTVCVVCKRQFFKRASTHLLLKVEVVHNTDSYHGYFIPVNGKLSKNQLKILSYYK